MKEYSTIKELKNDFITGDFAPIQPVKVGLVKYETGYETDTKMSEMISEGTKGVVVLESGEDRLLFLWGASGNTIIPYDVRKSTQAITEADIEDRIIPDKVEVHFLNLPISGSVIGKVDTGAEMCSLHAEQVQLNRGERKVSFVCPQLSHSRITAPITDQQAIKTSGGDTTYRPVITVSLKIHGKILKDIQVNLNDRSEMDHPMLVGQNALQAGKFLVDPSIIKDNELFSDEFLTELKKDVVSVPQQAISNEAAQKIYEAIDGVGDISVGDLMKLLRTQVLKNLEEVSY